mmetsp:Transcript_14036/g.20534  ORF Transcript_14036/g.20534 Transcript_14036/m.20534 type:complete len:228 (+) Transcript_14036:1609-2292(+)
MIEKLESSFNSLGNLLKVLVFLPGITWVTDSTDIYPVTFFLLIACHSMNFKSLETLTNLWWGLPHFPYFKNIAPSFSKFWIWCLRAKADKEEFALRRDFCASFCRECCLLLKLWYSNSQSSSKTFSQESSSLELLIISSGFWYQEIFFRGLLSTVFGGSSPEWLSSRPSMLHTLSVTSRSLELSKLVSGTSTMPFWDSSSLYSILNWFCSFTTSSIRFVLSARKGFV